ncbi:MAG: DUF3386 family protein, partial [Microcystaceae cyanobacterium]
GKRDFQEEYAEIGNYYLPTRQAVIALSPGGETTTTEFNFHNLQLLIA